MRLGSCHLGEDTTKVSFFSIGESVVHHIATLNGTQWQGAGNQDHGNMLAVCTSDAVDRAKRSYAVRHNQRTNAVDSRICIGRVGSVEFVAIPNPGRLTAVFELLHESQVVIAGNTKKVANTCLLKATK